MTTKITNLIKVSLAHLGEEELEEVRSAIRESIRLQALSFDAVKHLVLCQIEQRPPRLDLECYPYLPKAQVQTTSAREYMSLLEEGVLL